MTRITVALVGLAAAAANGQVVDGGSFDAEHGAPLWVQTIGTQFGNNDDPSVDFANGSELDAAYASISGGTLFVGAAGNLETNFNKLNVVLDFQAGGLNTINGLPNLGNLDGLTLDAGFEADVVLSYTAGNNPLETFVDGALADGTGGFLGGGNQTTGTNVTLDGAAISFFGDNSNVGGVNSLGNPNDSDPASVTTGIEMSIDLASLGWDGVTPIKIAAWVNGSGNDFLANQVFGGLPDGTGNLGAPSGVNFANIDGDQFVTIPAPATGLLALGGLAALRRRR